jgi:hypothetical protein
VSGPAPKIQASVDPAIYEQACIHLGLSHQPPVRFVMHGTQSRILGCYHPGTRSITIYANLGKQELERLSLVASDMAATLLHELKHAQQNEEHGSQWYAKHVVEAEVEAEEYALRMCQHYRGIVRVSRKHHGGGLARLETRVAVVRQQV